MNLREIFLGRPLFWALWVVIIAVLYGFGAERLHVRHFVPFVLSLLALVAVCIAIVLASYRKGEHLTREPFEENGADAGDVDRE